MTTSAPNHLPDQFGPWKRGALIGEGGAGKVFLARHMETNAVGALKVAHAKVGVVQRHWVRREAALAARLRHPFIVSLLDSGDVEGLPYLVYEHVSGPTLAAVADELSVGAIVEVGGTLLQALTYAHDAGVVHCDVTPSNIVLAGEPPRREARLIDFGLARARDERSGAKSVATVSGTPGYLSPEQARGNPLIGPSSDLFGCGAVLFRLLAGYAPYAGATTTTSLSLEPPLPLGDRYGLSETSPLARVVLKLLSEDPEMRYPSAASAHRAWLAAAAVTPNATARPVRREKRELITVHTAIASTEYRVDDVVGTSSMEIPAERAVPLVGRVALIEQLAELCRSGSTPTICLHGESGVGKSRVVAALAESLAEDMRTVCVHGRREVVGPPLECLSAIVASLAGATPSEPLWRSAERLHELVASLKLDNPESAEDALLGGLLGAGPGETRSATMAAVEVLTRLVAERPTLIVVDDADTVDPSTWEVLAALGEQPRGQAIVVRVGNSELEGAHNVPIALPAKSELEQIWAAFGGDGFAPSGSLSDLRAVAAAQRIGAINTHTPGLDPLTDNSRSVFASAFDSLPNSVADVLMSALAFGDDVPLRGISEILGPNVDLAPLLQSGLLTRVEGLCARRERWIRVPSKALGDWALEQLERRGKAGAPSLRERALRWLARCCRDAPQSNVQRVALLAERSGFAATASYAWAEAGQLALRAQRPGAAIRFLERSLQLSENHESIDRARVLAQLAAAHRDEGSALEEDRCAAEALALVEPERTVLRARLLRHRSNAAFELGRNEQALPLLEQAVALIGADGDPMESASCHAALGWLLGYRMGRNEEGIALGREALRIAARITAPAFQASLCGRLGANYFRAGDWDGQLQTNFRDLELSDQAHDVYGQIRANINLGVCFTSRGALETAREYTTKAYDLGLRHGASRAALVAANNLALIATHEHRAEDAALWAERVLDMVGDDEPPTETCLSLARIHLIHGHVEEARAAHARGAARADTGDQEHVARVGALIELSDGKPQGALTLTQAFVEQDEADPYEHATTKLTHAFALRRLSRDEEALTLESEADETLIRLGADPELERRRWTLAN